ncbi:hypothetical protein JZ751_026224 [Albula glossodonta]|uniref:Uncharacterized protein n=1 Tax=Albula glossodonta TaxID=121402 RepID=A0A8T2PFB0_9TELE|nr:hypothetical protein JZ751_026224 [Albula glossodonta]
MTARPHYVGTRAKGVFCGEIKLDALRSLCLTSQRYKKEQRPQEEEYDEEEIKPPIKFTTSKASHHSWTVDRSLGSDYQRPWWKVLPVSVFCVGVLLWCVFRDETEVDQRLEEHLYKHLPELLTDVEEDDVKEENAKPIS